VQNNELLKSIILSDVEGVGTWNGSGEQKNIQLVLTVRVSVGKQRQKQEYYGDNAKELLVK
jgi:hypothetical protein